MVRKNSVPCRLDSTSSAEIPSAPPAAREPAVPAPPRGLPGADDECGNEHRRFLGVRGFPVRAPQRPRRIHPGGAPHGQRRGGPGGLDGKRRSVVRQGGPRAEAGIRVEDCAGIRHDRPGAGALYQSPPAVPAEAGFFKREQPMSGKTLGERMKKSAPRRSSAGRQSIRMKVPRALARDGFHYTGRPSGQGKESRQKKPSPDLIRWGPRIPHMRSPLGEWPRRVIVYHAHRRHGV